MASTTRPDPAPIAERAGGRRAPSARLLSGLALALYLALSLAYAATRAPWWDEGLYADPARNLALHGELRSTVMAPDGTFGTGPTLPRMDERTYWTTPLYPVVLAGWFKAFGVGLLQMRVLSVLLTAGLLGCWWYVVRAWTGSSAVAALALGLMALDSHVLWMASIGRVEALACLLAVGAVAAYVRLRAEHFTRAVAAATGLFAAAALAHPLAAVEGLAFTAVALMLDWRRVRPRHVAVVLLVGAAVFAPWIAYVLQDTATFAGQWEANSRGRTGGLTNPLGRLAHDFQNRYLHHHLTALHGVTRLRIVELAALVAALAVAVGSPSVRRHPGFRLLAVFALVSWAALATLDGAGYVQYFAHVYPAYLALASLAVIALLRRGGMQRALGAALAVALVLPGVGGLLQRVAKNPYRTEYLTAVAAVRPYQAAGASIVAGSEFAFALGFDGQLVDDMELRTPADVYVQGEMYLTDNSGPWQRRVRATLARDYVRIFRNDRIKVFVRRGLQAEVAGRCPPSGRGTATPVTAGAGSGTRTEVRPGTRPNVRPRPTPCPPGGV